MFVCVNFNASTGFILIAASQAFQIYAFRVDVNHESSLRQYDFCEHFNVSSVSSVGKPLGVVSDANESALEGVMQPPAISSATVCTNLSEPLPGSFS